MQEIPATKTTNTDQSALLGTPTWEAPSADDAVFSGFMAYEASVAEQPASTPQPQAAPHTDEQQPQHGATSTETRDFTAEAEASRAAAERDAAERAAAERDKTRQNATEAAEAAEEAQNTAKELVDAENNLKDMKDVLVDAESFQGMRHQLEKYGLSEEDVATLERKVTSEKGMTWGELVTYISKNMTAVKTVDLDSDQRQQLMTFFQKLGFSAPESQRMVAGLENGNAEQVGATVNERLTTLPQDKLAGLDKDELDAFNQLLNKLQNESKAEERGLIRVVGNAMENAMDKARRMAQEQAFAKKVESGEGSEVKTLAETASASSKVDTSVDKAAVFSDETPMADQSRKQAQDADKLRGALSPEDQLKASLNKTGESISKNASMAKHQDTDSFLQQDSGTNDKAWNEFFEKLTLEETAQGSTLKANTTKAFADAVNQAKTTTQTSAKSLTRTEAPKVVKQVESAVLKNLSGGGKRLTLQLTPEHLGTLNVALSVKNSEVSATIRADNVETGRIIADQLEAIKQSLEEQGLKVSKLEVQTQLSGGDQGSWQGLAGQGKEFQQGMWSRMRSMQSGGSGVFSAEQMSEMAREAILSQNGNGLHVVA